MITYLTSEESIHDQDLRKGQIILNLVGRDWLEYGNALIVATTDPTLRIWQPERDINNDFRLTGRRDRPPHPSMDSPPSLYYLSRGDVFICDTADEANAIIEASLESRNEQLEARETVYKDKSLHNRQLTRDDVDVLLSSRESSRVRVAAVYAELTDGKYVDAETGAGRAAKASP
jgi:hypothetical protein